MMEAEHTQKVVAQRGHRRLLLSGTGTRVLGRAHPLV